MSRQRVDSLYQSLLHIPLVNQCNTYFVWNAYMKFLLIPHFYTLFFDGYLIGVYHEWRHLPHRYHESDRYSEIGPICGFS